MRTAIDWLVEQLEKDLSMLLTKQKKLNVTT